MAVETLIERLRAAGDEDSASAAAAELARTAAGVDALLRVVADKKFGNGRAFAVGGLRAAAENFPERHRPLADALARTFREGSDASRAAALALSEVDAPRAMQEALGAAARIEKAKPDKAVTLQRCVAYELGLLASRDAAWRELSVQPLAMLLRKRPSNSEAAEALGQFDDEGAFLALLDAVRKRDGSGYMPRLIESLVRSPRAAGRPDEVSAALARIVRLNALDASEAAAGMARFPQGRARLGAMLSHRSVPRTVIEAVGEARVREAVAPLLDLLAGDPADNGRDIILHALGQIGDERAAEGVVAQLDQPRWSYPAAEALAGMGRPGAVALIRRWEDTDPGIRAAVRASVRSERVKVIPPLLAELAGGADLDRALASRALARLDEPRATPLLLGLLRHESPVLRLAACDALAELTSPPPVQALAALLADDLPEIRASAAAALARDPEPAAGQLTALLDDPDVRVCGAAVRALAATGPSALPQVRRLLDHPAALVRNEAAVALAGLGEEGQAAIAAAAGSDQPDTRAAAAVAAGAMAGPSRVELLGALLNDPAAGVRVQALDAVPAEGEDLAPDIIEILHAGGERERDAVTRTLLRIASGDAQGWAGRALLAAIDDPSPVVVGAVAAAMDSALTGVDPESEPLPAWFRVTGDGYRLLISDQARAIIAALERAAARHPPAAATLATVRETLTRKLRSGWNELGIMYFAAPSREPSRSLIKSLSRFEPPVPDQQRYLDATLFHGGHRLTDAEVLRVGETYDLEVAVRASPAGISVAGKREPIAEPRQDKEIEVLVVAECEAGLSVDQPVAHLLLPPAGDSTVNAMFRVTAETASAGPTALAELRLRLFYRYSLLESAVIRAEVVSRFRPQVRSHFELETPITLTHDRIERGFDRLEDEIEHSLHIDVDRAGSRFRLRFTWEGKPGEALSLSAPIFITPSELEYIVEDTRRKLLRVTMSDSYALNLQPKKTAYVAAMRILAEAGRDLYVRLFRYKIDSSIAEIGKLLKSMPPSADSVIKVSVDDDASDFLFPWALLYDAPLPEETWKLPDPDGFWGLRYCIEQWLPGWEYRPAANRFHPNPQRMTFMLWEQFANSAEHRTALGGLSDAHPGDLKVSDPPINQAPLASKAMTGSNPGDIYYFYAHAHVRSHDRAAGMLDALVNAYDRLPPGAKAREALKDAYQRAVEAADEPSWIGLTYGHLKLNDLQYEEVKFGNSPLVFINACESSQLTPSLSGDSFVSFFLDRGAAAFIGTECTMTAVFAHPFGEFVLGRLLDGDTVGTALLTARRHFVAQRNPLGFAYSQYGYAGFRLTDRQPVPSAP